MRILHDKIKKIISLIVVVIIPVFISACEKSDVEMQRPWFIGTSILLLFMLALFAFLFTKSRRSGKWLESLVRERTSELALQTATLTTLFDSIPAHIFAKDLNFCYTQCNKSLLEHRGLCREDIIGKDDTSGLGVPAEIAEGFRKFDIKVISEGRTLTTEEYVPCIDGTNPLYETVKAPLILNGKIIGILGIARDITMRKEMEHKLTSDYEYANKLSDALANITKSPTISAGVLKDAADIIVKEGCIALNTSRVSVWSATEESEALKNISCYDSSTGEHSVQTDFDLVNRKKYAKLLKSERLIVSNSISSSVYDVLYDGYGPHLTAMLDAPIRIGGKMFGVVCSEQDRNEKFSDKREWTIEEQNFVSSLADLMALAISGFERSKAHNAAERASQIKSAFLANMSHEIRTPMNSIVGFSELAMDDEIPVRTKEYLARIIENSEGLLQIINDVLDISKVESGRMDIEKIPFDMHDLFTACRTLIMPKAVEKGIILHFYAEPSLGKIPLGDPTRLRQVLVNLLSNAVKFTNSGMVKLLVEVKDRTEETVTMHFEVKDSGIGMTREQIDKVFDPFMQAEIGTTRKYGGTGLGLTLTKSMVELMGGTLSVESTPGIGSRFSFELAFDTMDVSDQDIQNKKIIFDELEKPAFEGEVLLCEDNIMNQQVICEHLARVGLKTVVADNGKIGFDMVLHRKKEGKKLFDLIFMDIHMPVMDGLEASAKIIELNTGIPIIAMTANVMSSDRELYTENGMSDCVGKPFTSQELWRCLLKYLAPVNKDNTGKNMNTKSDSLLEKDIKFQRCLEKSFVKSNLRKYEEITAALESGDIKLAHRLAHTLKGNAGQLGKTSLQKAAADVEKNLSNGKNQVTPEQMTMLDTELKNVLEQLEAEFKLVPGLEADDRSQSAEPLDTKSARELIEKLEPMLKMGNPECCNFTDCICRIPGGMELAQQIEDFDFDHAITTLDEIKKELEKQQV